MAGESQQEHHSTPDQASAVPLPESPGIWDGTTAESKEIKLDKQEETHPALVVEQEIVAVHEVPQAEAAEEVVEAFEEVLEAVEEVVEAAEEVAESAGKEEEREPEPELEPVAPLYQAESQTLSADTALLELVKEEVVLEQRFDNSYSLEAPVQTLKQVNEASAATFPRKSE